MTAPNTEYSLNVTTIGGNAMGVVLANKPTEPLGFYGVPGSTLQTGVAVSAAAIHAALTALGLIDSSTAPVPPVNVNNGTLHAGASSLGTVTPGGSYLPNIYDLVPLTGGSGVGATAMININGAGSVGTVANDLNINIINGGTGYVVGDILSASTATGVFSTTGLGSGFQVVVSTLATNGAVTTGGIASTGTLFSGIHYAPGTYTAVPLTNGHGSGAQATIVVNGAGVVTTVTITAVGSGYAVDDELSALPASLGVSSNNPGDGLQTGGFLVKVATIA